MYVHVHVCILCNCGNVFDSYHSVADVFSQSLQRQRSLMHLADVGNEPLRPIELYLIMYTYASSLVRLPAMHCVAMKSLFRWVRTGLPWTWMWSLLRRSTLSSHWTSQNSTLILCHNVSCPPGDPVPNILKWSVLIKPLRACARVTVVWSVCLFPP